MSTKLMDFDEAHLYVAELETEIRRLKRELIRYDHTARYYHALSCVPCRNPSTVTGLDDDGKYFCDVFQCDHVLGAEEACEICSMKERHPDE